MNGAKVVVVVVGPGLVVEVDEGGTVLDVVLPGSPGATVVEVTAEPAGPGAGLADVACGPVAARPSGRWGSRPAAVIIW